MTASSYSLYSSVLGLGQENFHTSKNTSGVVKITSCFLNTKKEVFEDVKNALTHAH